MTRWRLPLAMYIALLVAHAPLLRLPYYWDEAGYYIFAALDFFHHGWLAPRSTLANGHPPLLSFFLAAAWALAGFHPLVTRAAMLLWAALLLWGVYVLARRRCCSASPPLSSPRPRSPSSTCRWRRCWSGRWCGSSVSMPAPPPASWPPPA